MRLIAILLFCASCSLGQPQPQTPQSEERNKAREKGSADAPQVPSRKEQPTRTPNKEAPAETGQNVDNDRRIANYTEVLAIVGVLQFFALIIQAFFLYRAFQESRQATELTRISIEEAVRSNAASEKLTIQSNTITRDATEVTRQSVILTHRPMLIVRNIVVPHFLTLPKNWPVRISGRFRIVNIGNGTAHVISVIAQVILQSDWPSEPITPVVDKEAKVIFSLPPGVYMSREFESSQAYERPDFDRIFTGTSPALFIQGYIGYRDDIGNFRSTSFCRLWTPSRRFKPAEQDDLENAD